MVRRRQHEHEEGTDMTCMEMMNEYLEWRNGRMISTVTGRDLILIASNLKNKSYYY
jgi:hypothetical protein